MAEMIYQQSDKKSTRMGADRQRFAVGRVLDDNRSTRQPIQRMTFNRFTSGGIMTNWGFYSAEEKKLLAKEAEVKTQLEGLRIDENNALNAEADILRTQFNQILEGNYTAEKYAEVESSLNKLSRRADEISTSMAVWLKNRENFNSKSAALPERGQIVMNLKKYSANPNFYMLSDLRELLDVAEQMVNDAVIFEQDKPEFIEIKEKIIKASTEIQKAFLAYVIQQDDKKATTSMLHGCAILSGLDFNVLAGLIANDRIKPKERESRWRVDAGSMMLARSVAMDNLVPDLVVGLPTAGAHIASRFAASYGLMTGHTPEVNLTRAHAVKEDSKAMMAKTGERDYFKTGEFEGLVQRLKKRMGDRRELTIFMVDDGMVSGNSIKKTHELYARKMMEAGFNVLIKTGLARGNSSASEGEVVRPDYVVEPRHDWAGDSRLMESIPDDDRKEVGDSYEMDEQWSARSKLSLEVELVRPKPNGAAMDKVKICDMLKPVDSLVLDYAKDERLPKGFKLNQDEPNYHIAGTQHLYM